MKTQQTQARIYNKFTYDYNTPNISSKLFGNQQQHDISYYITRIALLCANMQNYFTTSGLLC